MDGGKGEEMAVCNENQITERVFQVEPHTKQAIIHNLLFGGYSFFRARHVRPGSEAAQPDVKDIFDVSEQYVRQFGGEADDQSAQLAYVEVRSSDPRNYDNELWMLWQEGRRVAATTDVAPNSVVIPLKGEVIVGCDPELGDGIRVPDGRVASIAGQTAVCSAVSNSRVFVPRGSVAMIMRYETPPHEGDD